MPAAKKKKLDFTKVKDRGSFNPIHKEPGDYAAIVTKVEDTKSKDGNDQWLFTIKVGSGTYPYYCQFDEKVLWKIRNLFVACGFSVGKSRIDVDPNRTVGKPIGVSLDDDEYEGKVKSKIMSVFPTSELDPSATEGTNDEDVDEEVNEDDEETTPEPKAKKDKKKDKGKKKKSDLDEVEVEGM